MPPNLVRGLVGLAFCVAGQSRLHFCSARLELRGRSVARLVVFLTCRARVLDLERVQLAPGEGGSFKIIDHGEGGVRPPPLDDLITVN